MSTQEEARPTGSISEAAAAKVAEALDPTEEPDVTEEADPTEEPDVTEEPEAPADEAEEAADEAEADLPDDATTEQIAEARDQAREEFYAGRYKTREDAEAGIAEKDETIQRLYSDRDTLNRRLQAEEEARQQQAQEPEQLDLPAWDQWASEAVEAGAGAQGALDALTEGGYEGYQVYLRHWFASEEGEERAAATLFNNEVMLSMTEARAAAAAANVRAQPTAREQEQEAHQIVKGRRADFDDWGEQMNQVVEQLSIEDATYLRGLAEQGAEGKARALDVIYLEARARGRETSAATQVERQRRKVSGDNARLAATSPTSEGAPSRTPPPAAEQEGLRRKAEFRARMNLPPLEE